MTTLTRWQRSVHATSFAATVMLAAATAPANAQTLSGTLSSNIPGSISCGESFFALQQFATWDGSYTAGETKTMSRQGIYSDPLTSTLHHCSMAGSFSAAYESVRAALDNTIMRDSGSSGFSIKSSASALSSDRIQVLSKTLPKGTPVNLTVIWDLNWSGSVSYSSNNKVYKPQLGANPCFDLHSADLTGNHNLRACTYPDSDGTKLAKSGQTVFRQLLSTVVGEWIEIATTVELAGNPTVSGADSTGDPTSMSTHLAGRGKPSAEAKVYLSADPQIRLKPESGFKYRCPTRYPECGV